MLEFLFSTIWGWLGITTVVVLAALAVAWFFPPFRNIALTVAGGALAAAALYTKGSRDRATLEKKRKDVAMKKVRDQYDKIDKRKDTPESVEERMRRGGF